METPIIHAINGIIDDEEKDEEKDQENDSDDSDTSDDESDSDVTEMGEEDKPKFTFVNHKAFKSASGKPVELEGDAEGFTVFAWILYHEKEDDKLVPIGFDMGMCFDPKNCQCLDERCIDQPLQIGGIYLTQLVGRKNVEINGRNEIHEYDDIVAEIKRFAIEGMVTLNEAAEAEEDGITPSNQ